MDEKKAIQKDKLRAAPLIKLNVGDLIEQTNARGERTSLPRPFVGSIRLASGHFQYEYHRWYCNF